MNSVSAAVLRLPALSMAPGVPPAPPERWVVISLGWIYMKSLDGYKGPRQYLDARFTSDRAGVRSTVLRSKIVDNRVYYAAVERVCRDREVWALVCLIRYDPRDREGYVFGYKDMDESMEPYEYDCPESILKLLTPTNRPGAAVWRAKCRERNAGRRGGSTRQRT